MSAADPAAPLPADHPADPPAFLPPSGSPDVGHRFAPGLTLPVPVLVVEDEPIFQQRLRDVLLQLGYTPDALIFTATLAEARASLAQQPVALALIDLALPDGNGRELIASLRAQDPGISILVVTAWSSEDAILGALRAGATGYVLKERDDFEVLLSIRSALRGGAPIDPFIARRILELLPDAPASTTDIAAAAVDAAVADPASQTPAHPPAEPATPPSESLSKREREILRMVAQGLSNREISERLFLSYYTVETHIKRIYRKLAVSSRASAVRTALARGEID